MSNKVDIKTMRKSSSNHMIRFRKESHFVTEEKENNSMVILEKENKKLKFNVLDKGFFDKKKISNNLNYLKREFATKKEDFPLQNKHYMENPNNTVEEIKKKSAKLVNNNHKKVQNDYHYDVLSSSKRSFENNNSKQKPKHTEEILIIKKNIVEKNVDQFQNQINFVESNYNKGDLESIEFPYKICLICEVYFVLNQVVILTCEHIICFNCTKLYLEEKIEEGKKKLICPLFKCNTIFNDDQIKMFVTEKHYNNYLRKLELKEEKQQLIISNDEKANINIGKISQTSIDDFKTLSKKHVLEITNSINFLYYSKTKEIFCKNCNEESLFGKNCRNFIKCMNCLHSYCKYCGKNYSNGHFDFTGNNYCKIFYRRHCKYLPTVRNKCKEIAVEFVIFLAGYIIFFIGSLNLVHINLRKLIYEEKETTFLFISHITILILLYILVIPILLLLLPFYPMLVAIFR